MNQSEKKVLAVLAEHQDGLTLRQLHRLASTSSLRYTQLAVERMFGVYVDRWGWDDKRQRYEPVYCLVDVPEDCPRPTP